MKRHYFRFMHAMLFGCGIIAPQYFVTTVVAAPAAQVGSGLDQNLQGKAKPQAQSKDKNSLDNKQKTEPKPKSTPKPKTKRAPKSQRYNQDIRHVAQKYGISEKLLHAIVFTESRYNPRARGRAGEIGLMQIKPATARLVGFKGSIQKLYDPRINLEYGARYLAKAQKLGDGSICNTLLKYNAGHGAKKMNSVSKNYCKKVKQHLSILEVHYQ